MITVMYGRYLNLKRNWLPYAFMVALPIVLMIVFGALINNEALGIKLPVTDLDGTALSRALVEELESLGIYNINTVDIEHLKRVVTENEAEVGLIIPKGFGKSVIQGGTPQFEIFVTRRPQGGYSLQGVLVSAVQRIVYNASITKGTMQFLEGNGNVGRTNGAGLEGRISSLVAENWREKLPVKTIDVSGGHSGPNMFNQTSIGFTVAFSMFTIIFAVGEVLEEKRIGVWDRLSISPVSRFKVLTGGLICSFVMGIASMAIMVFVGDVFVGVNWFKHIGGVIVVLSAFCFCIVSLGMLLSFVVKTPQQLQVAAPVLLVSAAMLGGCYWPLEIVSSRALMFASKLVPTGWAMQALKDMIIHDRAFDVVYLPTAVMLMMGIIFLGVAMQLMEWGQ